MGSLTGALVAAGVAWASIVVAAFLPIPQAVFGRLRWVGAASIALVAFALVGVHMPTVLPLLVLAGGTLLAFAWPRPRSRQSPEANATDGRLPLGKA